MPLPCSQIPVTPHAPGLRLMRMATYCVHGSLDFVPPPSNREATTMMAFSGFNRHGFSTRSIRFMPTLRQRYAMFASERLPTFSGASDLPTGYR